MTLKHNSTPIVYVIFTNCCLFKNLEERYAAGYISSSVDLLPFGGTREMGSHKSYSMAMVVDVYILQEVTNKSHFFQ